MIYWHLQNIFYLALSGAIGLAVGAAIAVVAYVLVSSLLVKNAYRHFGEGEYE